LLECSGITQDGRRCRGVAIDGSEWCYAHDPARAEERRRNASKGGKRAGRGRPSPATAELARLQSRFEALADEVLDGSVNRGDAAVVTQLLNGARACVIGLLKAREQEELIERLETLEAALEANARNGRERRYGA
jgi:hypothetical protein